MANHERRQELLERLQTVYGSKPSTNRQQYTKLDDGQIVEASPVVSTVTLEQILHGNTTEDNLSVSDLGKSTAREERVRRNRAQKKANGNGKRSRH